MNLEANVGLLFNGDCEAAFKLYAHLLDAKLELVLTWGASPLADKAPREWAEKILFARLKGRSMTLTGADALPGKYQAPTGFNLCLSTSDAAEAERLFAELATGGTVRMPLESTFFADALWRSRRSLRHSVGGEDPMSDDRVVSLLTEIRDNQREMLERQRARSRRASARRAGEKSGYRVAELQREAVSARAPPQESPSPESCSVSPRSSISCCDISSRAQRGFV